jgi:hypothetical protein
VAITPDSKDWTWVLERPCGECGFDPARSPRDSFSREIRDNAEHWSRILERSDVRQRPNDGQWSPLEYACHVRDVYRIMDGRLSLMLEQDDPTFQNWDQDETALASRYDLDEPTLVCHELSDAANIFAERLESVTESQWQRPGSRSNGSRFSVESLGRYGVHDVVHHVWDVT